MVRSQRQNGARGVSDCIGLHLGSKASHISAVAIVCFAANRLYHQASFHAAAFPLAVLAWILVSALASATRPAPGVGRIWDILHSCLGHLLAATVAALTVSFLSSHLSGAQTGALAIGFVTAPLLPRIFLGLVGLAVPVGATESLQVGAAQLVALFAVHPYVRSALIGAGDALSYAQSIADFILQRRSGVFPVFVGQSVYAFNGGFHPLRNAPYMDHAAWILDILSLETLGPYSLLNLTVLLSIAAAVLGCYAVVRIAVPHFPFLALLLATLFGLCPAALAPLYGGDMYPTFLALPFLPWVFLGVQQSALHPGRFWPWAVQAIALSATWLAHPPIGAWATVIVGFAALWTLLSERRWIVLGKGIAAGVLFCALSSYLFVSVLSLKLPHVARADAVASIDYKLITLRSNWAGSFSPVSEGGNQLLGDIQLGYGVWLCLALGLILGARTRKSLVLPGCFALLLLFTWPIPILCKAAWKLLPTELLVVTNQWPSERFYILMGSCAVLIGAQGLGFFTEGHQRRKRLISALLCAACLWSAAETEKFFRRSQEMSQTEAESEAHLLPENIVLSRTHSYELVGMPSYFSNGHMDPRLEFRLLDAVTREPFADGASPSPFRAPTAGARDLVLQEGAARTSSNTVHLVPGKAQVLRFDFLGTNPAGELQLSGVSLRDAYTLPFSGLPRAFGSAPGSSGTLIVQDTTSAPEDIAFHLVGPGPVGSNQAFAHVRAEPLDEKNRAIRLTTLVPFRGSVDADRDSYLETPRLFVPGYTASVDNTPVPVLRSAEGLATIPIGRGTHEVTLDYKGSRLLRFSYFSSGTLWLLVLAFVSTQALSPRARLIPAQAVGAVLHNKSVKTLGKSLLVAVPVIALAILGARLLRPAHVATGDLHMLIRLPWPTVGRSEPLLTTGRNQAGDFIFITYLDGGHVQVAHDKWNYGGSKSRPIAVDYSKPQHVVISMSSLDPESGSAKQSPAQGKLRVEWNGAVVLSENVAAYPSKPEDVTVGANRIGGSSSTEAFSGDIVEVRRGASEPGTAH